MHGPMHIKICVFLLRTYIHIHAHKITFTTVAEVRTPPPGQLPAEHPRRIPFQYKSLKSLPIHFWIPTVLFYGVGVQYLFWYRKFSVTAFCRSFGHEQMISISETIAWTDDLSKTHTMPGVNLNWKQTASLWIGFNWHTASFSEHRTAPSGSHIQPEIWPAESLSASQTFCSMTSVQ